jgi:hypothetical protein
VRFIENHGGLFDGDTLALTRHSRCRCFRWERVKRSRHHANISGWIEECRAQKRKNEHGCSLSQRALVSTQVAGYSPNARFLAKKRAFPKLSVLQKVPENGPFLTCVDTNAQRERVRVREKAWPTTTTTD